MSSKTYYVYLLASKKHGVLYIGVTNNLKRRVFQHKQGMIDGFTRQYWIHKLVWYDTTDSIQEAITREKQLKRWKRDWKIRLIEEDNPDWEDLYEDS